jgi:hypothetical protein
MFSRLRPTLRRPAGRQDQRPGPLEAGQAVVRLPVPRAPRLHDAAQILARVAPQEQEQRVREQAIEERDTQRILGRFLQQPHRGAGRHRPAVRVLADAGSSCSWMCVATAPATCPASSRLESTPGAPGRSCGSPSTSQCASPPRVHSSSLAASVSNSSVLPERGAATMKIGRSKVCAAGTQSERRRSTGPRRRCSRRLRAADGLGADPPSAAGHRPSGGTAAAGARPRGQQCAQHPTLEHSMRRYAIGAHDEAGAQVQRRRPNAVAQPHVLSPSALVFTEQLVELPPVAAQRIEQVAVAHQPVGAPREGSSPLIKFGLEVPHEQIDLGRRHDGSRRDALAEHCEDRGRDRSAAGGQPPAVCIARGHEPPERSAARGIGDQVDALGIDRVHDPVQTPIVEQPRLAGGHVHVLIAAVKPHLGPGDDRNVQAYSREPVMVDVGMPRHTGARRQP